MAINNTDELCKLASDNEIVGFPLKLSNFSTAEEDLLALTKEMIFNATTLLAWDKDAGCDPICEILDCCLGQ